MQHSFAFYRDLSERPKKPERLFFCFMMTSDASGEVMQAADRLFYEHRLTGSRLRMERLHVSLHLVDDYRRLRGKHIYGAQLAGDAVRMKPFEVVFRSVMSFLPAPHKRHRRPLVLRGEGEGLHLLFDSLGDAMARQRLKVKAGTDFKPHMTLAYGPEEVPEQPIEPIRFTVKDFTLIHSRLGLTQYEVIDRWPLVA